MVNTSPAQASELFTDKIDKDQWDMSSAVLAEDENVARKLGIEGLYYITHRDNIPSILEKGILSHDAVECEGIDFKTVYDSEIVNKRRSRALPNGKSLWSYANLYFQPRNAMLYRLVNRCPIDEIAILLIRPEIINRDDVLVTDGNAASGPSNIYEGNEVKIQIPTIGREIDREWWSDVDGTKRKMMAECLVPFKVPPNYIAAIYVANNKAHQALSKLIHNNVQIIIDTHRFFQPQWKRLVATNLFLIKGDMFLSRMQTLTISVNCVGVMGKGLASTAKYRFPDVYVKYEDICKKKKLRMGRPYVHRRETSVLYDLEDSSNLDNPADNSDSQTWFLIFPTKNHWRQDSDFNGIEEGMQWVLENYRSEGISSLAMPALGCGLGRLKWEEVGPMMCKYLVQMDIPTAIYLPVDKNIPDEYLTAKFLLPAMAADEPVF